jgi:hypothetical protein
MPVNDEGTRQPGAASRRNRGGSACPEASLAKKLTGAAALAALEKDGRLFASPAEVAAVMDRDIRTIYGALERGEVPSTRIGQRYSIPLAWLRQQASGVPA